MMIKSPLVKAVSTLVLLMNFGFAFAVLPTTLNYQAYLTDATDQPIDEPVNVAFSLYNVSGGGIPLWSETLLNVPVTKGVLSVELGSSVAFPIGLFDEPLWIGLAVNGDAEMTPRRPITSTGFAFRAERAEIDADTLAALGCAVNEVAKWNGSTWVCAIDQGGGSSDWNDLTNVPAGFADGTDDGITVEADPTVPAGIKDGIAWTEVGNRPAGLDDGDDVGIIAETDPQVGSNTTNRVPKWNGSAMVTGTIFDDGNIGIGTTAPDHKLTVNGLGKFVLGVGNIAMSTPGGWPGLITYTQDGTRSDIVFDNDAVRIAKNVASSPPSLANGLTIHDSGNVGVGALNPAARLEVRGEVRTTSSAGASRLWGQGRPSAVRYGTTGVESGLCTNGAVQYGLSRTAVDWGDADAACPSGTWVCTHLERGSAVCNTQRPDGPVVDHISCTGGMHNDPSDAHIGWTADAAVLDDKTGIYVDEMGGGYQGLTCYTMAVWCCSGPN